MRYDRQHVDGTSSGNQSDLRSCCKIIYFRDLAASGRAKIACIGSRDNAAHSDPWTTDTMMDKPQSSDVAPVTPGVPGTPAAPATPPRRGPGHRGADMRDTVAEMAERAQLISQEAGSKVAAAMKDVISAAAGIAGFAIESARDLVQYMVKRGQMTPEEGDKLMREVEAAHDKRPP